MIIRIFLILLATCGATLAQVANDDVENRIELKLDAPPTSSTTKKATVEWACINKALTNKCLVYHNDQWFYFLTAGAGKRYLNISNQQCKNFKGVQVVVIEGNPCETETYTLIHCTSFTDQNDTFIELDSLKAEIPYLVLIDGFLGDQCDFEIQFSTKPAGFPTHRDTGDTLSLQVKLKKHAVELYWQGSQQQLDVLHYFEIFRQNSKQTKAEKLTHVSIVSNALGRHIENYTYVDSLTEAGKYVYQIIGVAKFDGKRILMEKAQVGYFPPRQEPSLERQIIQVPVNFSMPGKVELIVADAVKGNVLFAVSLQDGQNHTVPIDVTSYVNRGNRFFRIKAIHVKSSNMITQTFALNNEGEWVVVPK